MNKQLQHTKTVLCHTLYMSDYRIYHFSNLGTNDCMAHCQNFFQLCRWQSTSTMNGNTGWSNYRYKYLTASSGHKTCISNFTLQQVIPPYIFIFSFNKYITPGNPHVKTLRPRQMAAIFQTTFSNGFSWLTFHWSLFLRVKLTIFQHWFR